MPLSITVMETNHVKFRDHLAKLSEAKSKCRNKIDFDAEEFRNPLFLSYTS